MQLRTPLIDDLLDGVVALLVGVGADALEWVRAIHIRAPIANVDEGSVSQVDTDCASNGAKVCIGDRGGESLVELLLGSLRM
jgi:hypothetical protein